VRQLDQLSAAVNMQGHEVRVTAMTAMCAWTPAVRAVLAGRHLGAQ
jgi:hypothetical protein